MPPAPPPRSSVASDLRRNLLFLVVGVIVLDVGMYALKQALGVDAWSRGRQQAFTAGWVALTLVIVSVCLGRIRTARVRARRARAAGR